MIGLRCFFLVAASAPAPVPTTRAAIAAPPMRRAGTRSSLSIWGLPRLDSAEVVRRRGTDTCSDLAVVGVPGGRQPGAGAVRRRGGEQHSRGAGQPRRGVGPVAAEPAHL